MKCPHCGLIVTDMVPECQGCGFGIDDLDRQLGEPPARMDFVNDYAGLLNESESSGLQRELAEFQQTSSGELVLATITTTAPVKPSEYVFWLFNRWQIGGDGHQGLLILLAQKERRIECEVGYGWEPVLSDVESGEILDRHVVHLLQQGKTYEGLRTATEELMVILRQALSPHPQTNE